MPFIEKVLYIIKYSNVMSLLGSTFKLNASEKYSQVVSEVVKWSSLFTRKHSVPERNFSF